MPRCTRSARTLLTLALLLLTLGIRPASATPKDWNALLFGAEPTIAAGDVQAYATCAAFYNLLAQSPAWWDEPTSSNMSQRYKATQRTLTTLLGAEDLAVSRIKDAQAHLVFLTDGSLDSLKALHAQYNAGCLALLIPLTKSTRRGGQ